MPHKIQTWCMCMQVKLGASWPAISTTILCHIATRRSVTVWAVAIDSYIAGAIKLLQEKRAKQMSNYARLP